MSGWRHIIEYVIPVNHKSVVWSLKKIQTKDWIISYYRSRGMVPGKIWHHGVLAGERNVGWNLRWSNVDPPLEPVVGPTADVQWLGQRWTTIYFCYRWVNIASAGLNDVAPTTHNVGPYNWSYLAWITSKSLLSLLCLTMKPACPNYYSTLCQEFSVDV